MASLQLEGMMAGSTCLTLEEIESLEEIWEGFVLMDKHGVPKEHCQSLDDLKARLRQHFYRESGMSRSMEDAEDVIATLRREDASKREELRSIFEQFLEKLSSLDEQVLYNLRAEGTISGLRQDFEEHIHNLTINECPILVAGETSSGKSSLLNLLLGQEILPQRLLSCTSVICKIRYGPKLKAIIHREDGEQEEKFLDPNSNPVDQISKYIFKEDSREEGLPYRAVEIFIPLPLLQSGVYIIDSPGFGEHPAMDHLLMDYIANNEIFAFIYVIKSDNAGGVQEDRLQRILKHIVEKQHKDSLSHFDPRSAIFVCNRWDLVPETERDLVKVDNFKKLSGSWPELSHSQIFYLSTTKAWSSKLAGYVSEEYSQLLDGIQRLIPIGLQRKIQHSYRWLEHLLCRVLHQAGAYLSKTRLSAKELQARHKATELRLHRVEKESDIIMKRLDKHLDKCIRTISKVLSDFLKSEPAVTKMGIWNMDDLPVVHPNDIWMDTESEIDCIIEKRLAEILRDWDEENRLFQNVQVELLDAFKEEFLVLEGQLSSIEQIIGNDDLSLSDKSDEEMTKYLSLAENVDTSDSIFNFNLNTLQKIALGIAAPVLLPVAVGIIIGTPVFLLWDFKKWRRRSMAQKNMNNYIENPVVFVSNRALHILNKVADLDNVTEYVYNQMEPARNYLESMRSAIPKLVESNRSLIESITQDKRTSQEIEEKYLGYESLIPNLQETLAEYANLHLREYDFKPAEVEFIPTENIFGKSTRTFGIWTEIRVANVKHEDETHKVTVKLYRKKVSSMHLIMEEHQLRKIRHPHVAKFIGTFEAERGIPALVMEPSLIKARQELFGFRALPRASKGRNVLMDRCRRFLEQVAIGLEYLHYRGLTHMELSLDTVMFLANKQEVKLTNVGEPRRANLPDTLHIAASDYVYLPPEVLKGAIYRMKGDMYSLGVMAWELWNQDVAFKLERKMNLEAFITPPKPHTLDVDENNPFRNLIELCMQPQPEDRMCSTTFVNEIRRINLQPTDDYDDEK